MFLGVFIRSDCKTNMTVQRNRVKDRVYEYLRCQGCKGGATDHPTPT